jgi:hypothetical protein
MQWFNSFVSNFVVCVDVEPKTLSMLRSLILRFSVLPRNESNGPVTVLLCHCGHIAAYFGKQNVGFGVNYGAFNQQMKYVTASPKFGNQRVNSKIVSCDLAMLHPV